MVESPAPLYPLEGVVSWNVCTTCNYRCSYCTQRHVDDRTQRAEDVPAFIDALTALPGDWEVKLSGGEPFLHPGFDELVVALAEAGVRVSVVTNLSASPRRLARFAELTRQRPGLLSASLHLEHADPDAFIAKLAALTQVHAGTAHATVVATRALLPELPALVARFAAAGLELKVQPEKQDRDVIAYTAEERAALEALGGHNGTGRVAPDLRGRGCWAGSRYLVVDHRGDAWPCYPARRYRQGFLGNLVAGTLRLEPGPRPCPFDYCNCTVPQQRGMVSMHPLPPEATEEPPCSLDR